MTELIVPLFNQIRIRHKYCKPTLADVIKLRMYEIGLTQASLTKLIGVSPSRVCDYLSGKSEPTLKIGRAVSKKLDFSSAIVLGV